MPAVSPHRRSMGRARRALAVLAAASVAVSAVVATTGPAAARTNDYTVDLAPATVAGGAWVTTGHVAVAHTLALASGGAVWQGIGSTAEASTPQPGDVVHGAVDVIVHDDVDADATVLIRVTDDRGILAEHADLTAIERGHVTTVETSAVADGARMREGASTVYVELHNDTSGAIEFTNVRLWGERDGQRIDYALPNAAFEDGLANDTWGSNRASVVAVAELSPGARAERAIAIGEGAEVPASGDLLALQGEAFATAAGAEVAVVAGGVELVRSAITPAARWQRVQSEATEPVPADAATVSVVVTNPTSAPLRLRALEFAGTPAPRNDDLNGDGRVDALDRDWFAAAVAGGTASLALDYDGDGEVTRADVDYFTRLVLGDQSVVLPTLAHLDFLSEDVEIEGQPMTITHLYSEPRRSGDPSSGYVWVGDPQEGVSAVDDVARAVIAYAEHYRSYGDAHSYRQMVSSLRFVMWMQAANGDFDNFVARDSDGKLVKKHSQSSQTSFGYWAVRAWDAFATALPLLQTDDAGLASEVQSRLDVIRGRVNELLAAAPAHGEGRLLGGDVWMSSIAVNAASREYASADAGARAALAAIVDTLAEGISAHQRGSFTTYPLGAIQNSRGGWDEWGSVQVEALARASVVTGDQAFLDRARLGAESFLSDLLLSGRAYSVSPNKAGYPQLNYGTASYVDNFLALYEVTGERVFADAAGLAASWWRGNNPAQTVMFHEDTGVAFDAVDHDGVNRNSGGESVVEALRGILRVQRVPAAVAAMTAIVGENVAAQRIEGEDLARAVGGDDVQKVLPDGALNDPALAVVTQSEPSGFDEQAIYEDAQRVDVVQDIYRSWKGRAAVFVAGSGHNNVRLFDGGSIETRIGVGGEGEAAPGDSVALRFSAIVQFDTDLDAEVLAVNAEGAETVLSDDSAFAYHPRTWYSGSGAVRTSPLVDVPADATELIVRFSVTSTKPIPAEGYANVTEATLWRIGTPELRYGASDLSGGAYALLAPNSVSDWTMDVARADDYLVYASVRSLGDAGGDASLTIAGQERGVIDGAGTDGQVVIVPVGRMTLAAGATDVRIATAADGGLGIDALILYPVRTSVSLGLRDGTERVIVRDAESGRLLSGTATEVIPTPTPTPTPTETPAPTPTGVTPSETPSAGASGSGALAHSGGEFDAVLPLFALLAALLGTILLVGVRRRVRS